MKRLRISLVLLLAGCCPEIVKPDNTILYNSNTIEETEIANKYNRLANAERDITNEKLINYIEGGKIDSWKPTAYDIISKVRELNEEYFTINISFTNLHLFSDGSLFLDHLEQSLSTIHKERLKKFYERVKK